MKLEVEREMIEPIVRDHIATAIVGALGNSEELVQTMVNLALNAKVNREGKISKYPSDNKYDFVEAIAGKAIREAARDAVIKIVDEQHAAIEIAIRRELTRRPQKTAAAIIAAFCEGAASQYRIKAEFHFGEPE